MTSPPPRNRRPIAVALILLLAIAGGFALFGWTRLPKRGERKYEEYVAAFQVGAVALDAPELAEVAKEKLSLAIRLVPREPAAWANRGLLHLRGGQLDEAGKDLAEANRLAPGNADVEKLSGLLEQRRGRFSEAAKLLRQALQKDPDDIQALYLLTQIVAQERLPDSDEETQKLLEQILARRPQNLLVLSDRLRVANKRNDREAVLDTLRRLRELSGDWSERTRKALTELEQQASKPGGSVPLPAVLVFSNLLRGEGQEFVRSAEEANPPNGLTGNALQNLLRLPPIRHEPAPPDLQLAFEAAPLADVPPGSWKVVVPVWMDDEGKPTVLVANDTEVRQAGSDESLPSLPLARNGVVPFDWNNDFLTDLVLLGEKGLRFYLHQSAGGFDDVTEATGLPDDVLTSDFTAAVGVDVDLDADLDLLVARRADSPLFLRNNLDGTFSAEPVFADVQAVQELQWADLDNDGLGDAVLLDDQGRLYIFRNRRSGKFAPWPAPPPRGRILGYTSFDANDDGVFDLVTLHADGVLLRNSDQGREREWDVVELGRWEHNAASSGGGGPKKEGDNEDTVRLLQEDFDNNGVVDLLASNSTGSRIWMGSGRGDFIPLETPLVPDIVNAVDLDEQGRIDLLAIDAEGRPLRLSNRGTKNYHWQIVRPRASRGKADGDQRINSNGIGGDIELRTGTHVIKRPIQRPVVRFGLGEKKTADVIRIRWPSGKAQLEFPEKIDQPILANQRLTGSCPFLYAWNGERIEFVNDFMWSTPLGMFINASNKGGFLQTTDWTRIRGDQLAPQGRSYELRVNANLWETHFFDHIGLLAIDHPPGTEMYVDERFFMKPQEPAFHLVEPPSPVPHAIDHLGRDATKDVQSIDGVYLDRAGRGVYQGITNDHWVEIDLGENLPTEKHTGPLWLLAYGWVHPTDSSINFAITQGRHVTPSGLSLEIPDGEGHWKVLDDKLGFPAGKNKTVMIRLDTLAGGVPRKLRLRTNMEIYWDALQTARGATEVQAIRHTLQAASAELRFRGIVAMSQANPSSPELPHYDRVVSLGQTWRDLTGFHTRFGDVQELLASIDDRYAILSAGDELVFQFIAPEPPPAGWKRDFIWVSDGWVKDGNLNTRFGDTVLPLPAHDQDSYNTPPRRLEDDPIYQRHPGDWENYHTRYITPYFFDRGLRNFKKPVQHGSNVR